MFKWLAVLALCGCAAFQHSGMTFTAVVQSENWDANVVTMECENGRRLVQFRGLMRGQRLVRTVELPEACFGIRTTIQMLGGRTITPRPEPIKNGDTLFVVIPPYVGAIATHGAVPDSMGVLVEARQKQPLGIHYGIWRDVERCVGQTRDPTTITWISARMIIMADGGMAYGMTALDENRVPYMIAIEWGHWLDSRVISHEAIHAITGVVDHSNPIIARCSMNFAAMDTVARFAPPDTAAKYLSGGN